MAEENNQKTGSEFSRNRSRVPDPQRFRVSKATLRLDRFMTRFILVGGLGVIFAIFGIFFFILAEILPLFRGAKVEPARTFDTAIPEVLVMGTDEWTEYPFLLQPDGRFQFLDLVNDNVGEAFNAPLKEDESISAAAYLQEDQIVLLGLSTGDYITAKVAYSPQFAEDGSRTINAAVNWDERGSLGQPGEQVISLDGFVAPQRKTIAAIVATDAGPRVSTVSLVQKRSLFGASGFKPESRQDLTDRIKGEPQQVLVGANAESVIVRSNGGTVHVFNKAGKSWNLQQEFNPFPEAGSRIASMSFIKGAVSLCFTATDGRNVIWSLFRSKESGERLFGETKVFKPFPGGAVNFARSSRNKAFLLGNGSRLSLRYSTTADIRWEAEAEAPLQHLLISGKFDRIMGLDPQGVLHLYDLEDPHPEAGFRAFFAKVWYEGQDEPQYLWQSTGGSDDFEPKLSLIPLIVGSLKGTFYALVFAIPIALLAAIYTSQFLNPSLKRVIKPGIEIMASLPSVVLGFLAALWLAPLIEDRIPSVILVCIGIPATAVLFGYVWNLMPIRIRVLIPKGWEFIIFLPTLVGVSIVAWYLGPLFENVAFRLKDPSTGQVVADFRLWWESWSGSQFQQRNSLVVGFMMGFAVIPIIYTIADDALSAVPPSLTSGSLALGASRWQTTARIILPTASAGIFSACMIGLGRAVGETMIVVMATGNTPILDFDIFSGMRTLSANIAVELPEAPHGGTLYRTLFLGAFVLFVLTFAVNTLAEVMRTRLRERYKVIN
jgi:phosphate transport system permease protein